MRDEEYVFFTDCREKKSVAASAFKKRRHNGKGGRVKLPSDYLSKKELKAMNGEEKSYRLNEPMSWQEFRAMPDDIKVMYIKLLREKFKISSRQIAIMMGCDPANLGREFKKLGIAEGKYQRTKLPKRDMEAWYAWCNRIPAPTMDEPDELKEEAFEPVEEVADEREVHAIKAGEQDTMKVDHNVAVKKAIPMTGNMVFEGKTADVLGSIFGLLGGANIRISVTWDVLDSEE